MRISRFVFLPSLLLTIIASRPTLAAVVFFQNDHGLEAPSTTITFS